jgi:hypothetical protein
MNKIQQAIKCANCNKKISSAVLLPCGESICSRHIQPDTTSIYCHLCDDDHDIPKEGLRPNKALNNILDAKIEKIDLGSAYKKTLDAFDMLDDEIAKAYLLANDQEYYVSFVTQEWKNRVDTKREVLKMMVDEEANRLVKKIDDHHQEFVNSFQNETLVLSTQKLQETVQTTEKTLQAYRNSLNALKVEDEKWETMRTSVNACVQKLSAQKSRIKNLLLMNKYFDIDQDVKQFCEIDIMYKM